MTAPIDRLALVIAGQIDGWLQRHQAAGEDGLLVSAEGLQRISTALRDAEREIEEARAGWRPIETAPKDGRDILVRMPDWCGPQYQYKVTHWITSKSAGGFWDGIYSVEPKLWTPIPAPPAQREGE